MTFKQASDWAHEKNLIALRVSNKIRSKKIVLYEILSKDGKVMAQSPIGWKDVILKYERD